MIRLITTVKNEVDGLVAYEYGNNDRSIKLIVRINDDSTFNGFTFVWMIKSDYEKELCCDKYTTVVFSEIIYVFDGERCIINVLSDKPPYSWLITIVQTVDESMDENTKNTIIEILTHLNNPAGTP